MPKAIKPRRVLPKHIHPTLESFRARSLYPLGNLEDDFLSELNVLDRLSQNKPKNKLALAGKLALGGLGGLVGSVYANQKLDYPLDFLNHPLYSRPEYKFSNVKTRVVREWNPSEGMFDNLPAIAEEIRNASSKPKSKKLIGEKMMAKRGTVQKARVTRVPRVKSGKLRRPRVLPGGSNAPRLKVPGLGRMQVFRETGGTIGTDYTQRALRRSSQRDLQQSYQGVSEPSAVQTLNSILNQEAMKMGVPFSRIIANAQDVARAAAENAKRIRGTNPTTLRGTIPSEVRNRITNATRSGYVSGQSAQGYMPIRQRQALEAQQKLVQQLAQQKRRNMALGLGLGAGAIGSGVAGYYLTKRASVSKRQMLVSGKSSRVSGPKRSIARSNKYM